MRTLITIHESKLRRTIFNEAAIEKLQAVSEVDWVKENMQLTVEELAECIGEYDACITSWKSPKFTKEVIAAAKKLKFVGHAAGTVVPYVDPCIFETGIKVVNANRALAASTAELAVAIMMAGAWNIRGYNALMKNGQWTSDNEMLPYGIQKQTVGIIGLGEISRYVISFIKPFSPNILLFSNHCTEQEAKELGVTLCSLEQLLKKSDIVSLHNTLTDDTVGMIGEKQLAMLKDEALLVNTARAPIVNQEALLKELKSGRIFAALDVYDKEPMDSNNILLSMPNVICTPHIGGTCHYWKSKLFESVVDDLIRFVNGEPLIGEINAEKFARLTWR